MNLYKPDVETSIYLRLVMGSPDQDPVAMTEKSQCLYGLVKAVIAVIAIYIFIQILDFFYFRTNVFHRVCLGKFGHFAMTALTIRLTHCFMRRFFVICHDQKRSLL